MAMKVQAGRFMPLTDSESKQLLQDILRDVTAAGVKLRRLKSRDPGNEKIATLNRALVQADDLLHALLFG